MSCSSILSFFLRIFLKNHESKLLIISAIYHETQIIIVYILTYKNGAFGGSFGILFFKKIATHWYYFQEKIHKIAIFRILSYKIIHKISFVFGCAPKVPEGNICSSNICELITLSDRWGEMTLCTIFSSSQCLMKQSAFI